MPVRLRLAMHGQRNNRIFHLVAIDLRKRRDAKPIETLGIYDQRLRLGQKHKTMEWSVDRIKYWLEKGGALPSKSVVKLLEKVSIFGASFGKRPATDAVICRVVSYHQTRSTTQRLLGRARSTTLLRHHYLHHHHRCQLSLRRHHDRHTCSMHGRPTGQELARHGGARRKDEERQLDEGGR